MDFIRNNRRIGELRPAQTRSPVTGLFVACVNAFDRLSQGVRVRVLGPSLSALRFLAARLRHPLRWQSTGPSRRPGGGMGWGAVGESPCLALREVGEVGGNSISERCCFWPPALSRISPPPLLRAPRASECGASLLHPWYLGNSSPAPASAPRR